jgi:hypothetical protein
MELMSVLTLDQVTERQQAFMPMFCCQVVWAIIEDGRAYFAQQLTVDDFAGIHPDDIVFSESTVNELKPHLRNQAPIFWSSFPQQWTKGLSVPDSPSRPVQQAGFTTVNVPAGGASLVSALSGPTATTNTTSTVTIWATTHPKIKSVFAAYIQKFRSVRLLQLLNSLNQTMADLPTLPSVTGNVTLCYNYILGRCVHSGCQHKHVPVKEVMDKFATALVNLLQPAVTNFLTNGAPPMP